MFARIRQKIKQAFLAGLLFLIPLFATIWVIKTLVIWTEDFFLGLVPSQWHPQALFGESIPGVGLISTFLLILIVGSMTRSFLAARLIKFGESILARIPIARGVYPGIKRLMNLLFGDKQTSTTGVAIIPYPHANCRAYAFVTGEIELPDETGEIVTHIRAFVPTTPNPTSGFLLMVPKHKTIPTDMTMEQASRMIVSGGLV